MLWIIFIISAVITMLAVYFKSTYAIYRSRKRLDGKTALVTGGTAGMGLEIAKDFANRGARVLIACPFEEEGLKAQKYITKKTGNNEVIFKLLDLSSLASVRKFTNEVNNEEARLDILVNNAGIYTSKDFITADGLSYTMEVNYFGHFILTILLLPLLKKSGQSSEPSRIVNVTSLAHSTGKIDFGKINHIENWTHQVYANSKLCMVLFTRELARKLKESNVVINNADPGVVATFIAVPNNVILKSMMNPIVIASRFLFKTPWEGAQTAIYVALDINAQVSGEMFYNCQLSKAATIAYDEDMSRQLWHESVKLVKLNLDEVNI